MTRMLVLNAGTVENVIAAYPGFEMDGRTVVEAASAPAGAGIGWTFDGEDWAAPAVSASDPTTFDVDVERDRRVSTLFVFGGNAIQLDKASRDNITSMGAMARFAILDGALENDYSWLDTATPFAWTATDNTPIPMDAQTMEALSTAAAQWVYQHHVAARVLKDMEPIPATYADDQNWP